MSHPVRKAASLVVLVVLIIVGGKLLGLSGSGPVPVEIHYLLGDPPIATAVEVLATPAGQDEVAARFATTLIGPDVVQRTRLPSGEVRLAITLVAASGQRRTALRTINAERNAIIRIDLSRDSEKLL